MKIVKYYPYETVDDGPKVFNLFEWKIDQYTHAFKRDADFLNEKESTFNSADREFLNNLYQGNLSKLTSYLNEVHKVKYREEIWEILIGPWLRISIFAFYDRWLHIESLSKSGEVEIQTQKFSLDELIPKDFNSFHKIFYQDKWNAHVFSLMSEIFGIKLDLTSRSTTRNGKTKKIKSSIIATTILGIVRNSFFVFAYKLINIFNPLKKGILLYNATSYKHLALFLFREGKGCPLVINDNTIKLPLHNRSSIYYFRRLRPFAKFKRNKIRDIKFEEFIFSLLLMTIPRTYLEDYSSLSRPFPLNMRFSSIKTIFTSTSQWNDDPFKKWLMERKNEDNYFKIIIWQHGGTYGTTEHVTHQEFIETKVYDYFLSWGWKSNGNDKIIPFNIPPNLKLPTTNKKPRKKRKILVILTRLKKYSKGDPWDSIEWNGTYMNSLIKLSNELYKSTNIVLTYRVHPSQKFTGLDIKAYLNENTAKSLFDEKKKLKDSITEANLTIVTQNSTVLLQLLMANLPVICFWDLEISGFRSFANVEFGKLHKVGIFHDNVHSLICFLESNNMNIDEWWFSERVQSARREFCLIYASTSKDISKRALNLMKL